MSGSLLAFFSLFSPFCWSDVIRLIAAGRIPLEVSVACANTRVRPHFSTSAAPLLWPECVSGYLLLVGDTSKYWSAETLSSGGFGHREVQWPSDTSYAKVILLIETHTHTFPPTWKCCDWEQEVATTSGEEVSNRTGFTDICSRWSAPSSN